MWVVVPKLPCSKLLKGRKSAARRATKTEKCRVLIKMSCRFIRIIEGLNHERYKI